MWDYEHSSLQTNDLWCVPPIEKNKPVSSDDLLAMFGSLYSFVYSIGMRINQGLEINLSGWHVKNWNNSSVHGDFNNEISDEPSALISPSISSCFRFRYSRCLRKLRINYCQLDEFLHRLCVSKMMKLSKIRMNSASLTWIYNATPRMFNDSTKERRWPATYQLSAETQSNFFQG